VAFFFGQSRCQERERPPFPNPAWQIPTGAHLKILPKQTHTCSKLTVSSPTVPQVMTSIVEATTTKKINIFFICYVIL